jgi:hypothetical protein
LTGVRPRYDPSRLLATVMHALLNIGEVRVRSDLGRVANVLSEGPADTGAALRKQRNEHSDEE